MSAPRSFTLGLCQMPVTERVDENLRTAGAYVRRAAAAGADLVVLPEMFCCPYDNDSFVKNRQPAGGQIWTALSEAARENGVYLVGGSMPESDEAGRIFNTCFIFDRTGEQIGRHRKVHLFDIDVPGGQYFKESDTFTAGDDVTVVDTDLGKIGVAICFDMRFPDLSRVMMAEGAQLIVFPGAFNMTTGPAHWTLTLRARALDDQLYTAGCCQARDASGSYVAYGHSLVASPWGDVLAELEDEEGLLTVPVDPTYIGQIRRQLPLITGIREDVYTLPGRKDKQ